MVDSALDEVSKALGSDRRSTILLSTSFYYTMWLTLTCSFFTCKMDTVATTSRDTVIHSTKCIYCVQLIRHCARN